MQGCEVDRGSKNMRYKVNRSVLCLVVVVGVFLGVSTAQAVPPLQLYLEGATYDAATESWVLVPADSSSGEPFRLWALGNIVGPGGHGPLDNVRLSVAYEAVDVAPTITLTPSAIDSLSFPGWIDPTTPTGTGTWIQEVTDGSAPVLGDGSSLPSHGIFGPGTHWQEFGLGYFGETGSSVADVIDVLPLNPTELGGHINVYDVSVLNGSGMTLHFDLYDTLIATNHAKFAPFSHDAEIVPIPGTAVLAIAGFGLVGILKRRLR